MFPTKTDYTVGDGPRSVFSADLDGDGDMDLAVANSNSDNISVLLNNGYGMFPTKTDYTVGGGPRSVFSSDLDGDGDMDLAVANWNSNNVSVILNNGNGTFQPKTDYAAGDVWPGSVFSSDLDGDGDMDLAVTTWGHNTVSILLNNGNGTFQAAMNYGAANNPYSVFSADLDGDGDMDLAVANTPYSSTVSVFLNLNSEADISLSPDSLNFIPTKIGNTTGLQFIVYNNGADSTLQITDITSSNPVFGPNPTSASIAPGNSVTITVNFTPTDMVNYSDSLTIFSNDPNDPEVKVYVAGSSPPPVISLSLDSLNYGTIKIDSSESLEFQINNNGVNTLEITNITSSNSAFVPGLTSASVLPGNSAFITVNFTPTAAIAYSDSLTIYSNDPNNPQVKVYVSGEGRDRVWHVSTSGSDLNDGTSSSRLATIQHGIDMAAQGDTVLVHPGTYVENINFNGKNLVLGSLFLVQGDTSYISSTIIDGNQNGSVVTFESGEDSTAILAGVTIQNGLSQSSGGIRVSTSSPVLLNLLVKNNQALSDGGGIQLSNSDAKLIDLNIFNNVAGSEGGGLRIDGGSPYLRNTHITDNNAQTGAGLTIQSGANVIMDKVIIYSNSASNMSGALSTNSSNIELINSLVYNNNATSGAGGLSINYQSNISIINSTIYGNEGVCIYSGNLSNVIALNCIIYNESSNDILIESFGEFNSRYCIVSDDWIGEGNIYTNPFLLYPGSSDFRLNDYSPCLGAGSDSAQIDGTWYYAPSTDIDGNPRPNPPGSNPDMGAYENPLAVPLHNSLIHVTITGNDTGSVGLDTAPFAAIQAAIDYSQNTDTVLVHPGTYVENINFNGKNIVLGSLFLVLGDTSYISSTIIDGNQNGSVVTFESGEDSTTFLVGLTILNGIGEPGGGIRCVSSNPNLSYLLVQGNSSVSSGGGIHIIGNSNPVIEYSKIVNNSSNSWGGGISCADGNVIVFQSEIINNSSIGNGGGINSWAAHLEMTEVIVRNNSSTDGGAGISANGNSDLIIRRCLIQDNESSSNWAAGIQAISSTAEIFNTQITQNSSNGSNAAGIGSISSNIMLTNSSISNNTTAGGNGVLFLNNSNLIMLNSILWNNDDSQIWYGDGSIINIAYSNVEGGENSFYNYNTGTYNWLDGNIESDPCFSYIDEYIYSLFNYSPVIGSGIDSLQIEGTWYYATSTDIAGNPRPNPAGSNPDMGAYESPLASQYPLATDIRDGLDEDINWTNSSTVLKANWDPFIDDSTVTYECAIGIGDSAITEFLEWTDTGTDTFATLAGLSLTSSLTYYISLRGTDIHGQMSDTITTDGILVDLIDPMIGELWDGDASGDIDWQGSTSEYSIYWTGSDSRVIANYQYCLGSTPGDSNTFSWMDNGTTTSVTIIGLNLIVGDSYYASVRAVDEAGNWSNTMSSDGVTIDGVAPVAGQVFDDLNGNGEYYAAVDSPVFNWTGFYDEHSGIDHYELAVGTSPGSNDVWPWVDTLTDTVYGIAGISLSDGITYYASVRAVDRAGNQSVVVSSDGLTIDVSEPITGIVNDGLTADIDWSNSASGISGNWSGFSDGLSGIEFYEYAVGTMTGSGDLIDWTYNSTATSFDSTGLSLNSGITYYISVRATDLVGNLSLPASSDGVLIDLVNPLIGDLWDGNETGDIDWQVSTDSYSIYWTGSDSRAIANYQYSLSSQPGDSNIVNWTDNGTETSVTVTGLNLTLGNTYYANVQAIDQAGNRSNIISSDGITIDNLAPVTGQVFDDLNGTGEYYAATDSLVFNWTGFHDEHSGIDHYKLAVGTSPGSSNVWPWEDTLTDTVYGIAGISFSDGITYYASIRAVDLVGNQSAIVSTDGLTIDVSGPDAGTVIDGILSDQDWTNSAQSLTASWSGFSDATSGIDHYEYSLGTDPGGTDIVNWSDNGTAVSITVSGLSLTEFQVYYWNVRAVDLVGNISTVVSTDGIGIDTIIPVISSVIEGSIDTDMDYTDAVDSLFIHVQAFADVHSGIDYFEFALGSSTGDSDIVAWQTGIFTQSTTFSGLSLAEGLTYYGTVRAWDRAGNRSAIFTGDGITPDLTPPAIGTVNDGLTEDIIYTSTDTTASANWSGFTDNLSGIAYYEYALGTQAGEADIVAFTDCGLLTVIEATGLSLEHGQTYYFAIRAIDLVGNTSAIASSNGFVVDKYAGPPVVTVITPIPFALAPAMSDLSITLELSEPIRDYSLTVSSYDNSGYSYVGEYLDTPPRINISLTGSLPYADTLSIILNDYDDLVGLIGEVVEIEYYMPYLADFNQDWIIDVLDLAEFASDWSSAELIDPVTLETNELGPLTGDVPYFMLYPDSTFNIRDVMAFTRMWNWSHQSQTPALLASGGSFGEQPEIEQRGNQLILSLPAQAEAGQVIVQYASSVTEVFCQSEDGTASRILLKDQDREAGRLLVEYAYLSKTPAKSIVLDIKALTRDNSIMNVWYSLYSESKELVGQGSQTIELVAVPEQFALHQNYPNPFNPITTINYDLPEDGQVKLAIYDIMGRQVIKLLHEHQQAGYKSIRWNGRNTSGQVVSAGMYFYALEAGKYSAIRKMILLK